MCWNRVVKLGRKIFVVTLPCRIQCRRTQINKDGLFHDFNDFNACNKNGKRIAINSSQDDGKPNHRMMENRNGTGEMAPSGKVPLPIGAKTEIE
jgi:hypothetical protein